MKNLDRPCHGWEGLSNGGEIYGNQSNKVKEENKQNVKLEMFNDMISKGMDRTMAYQIVYGLNHEEAKELAARDTYNNLISCGVPSEIAEKLAYNSREDKQKSV